jgi:hypothetical protein
MQYPGREYSFFLTLLAVSFAGVGIATDGFNNSHQLALKVALLDYGPIGRGA